MATFLFGEACLRDKLGHAIPQKKERIGKNGAFFVKFSYLEKMKNFQIGVFGCKTRKKWKQLEKHVCVMRTGTHHATDKLTKSGRLPKIRIVCSWVEVQ